MESVLWWCAFSLVAQSGALQHQTHSHMLLLIKHNIGVVKWTDFLIPLYFQSPASSSPDDVFSYRHPGLSPLEPISISHTSSPHPNPLSPGATVNESLNRPAPSRTYGVPSNNGTPLYSVMVWVVLHVKWDVDIPICKILWGGVTGVLIPICAWTVTCK